MPRKEPLELVGTGVFHQQRVGQDRRLFTIYKSRTMTDGDATQTNEIEYAAEFRHSSPRVTTKGGDTECNTGPARSDIESVAGSECSIPGGHVDDAALSSALPKRNSVCFRFGCPRVVLRAGGFLYTVVGERAGIFFDAPAPEYVAIATKAAIEQSWDQLSLQAQSERFSAASFQRRIRQVVAEESSHT